MAANTSWSGTRRSFPKSTARLILTRANGRCEINGPDCIGIATEADHRIPHAEGGSDHHSNGAAVCKACHQQKTREEQRRGNARKPKLARPTETHPGIR